MSDFRNYLSDLITEVLAGNEDTADFLIHQGDDEIIYVDPEAATVWLITVKEGRVTVPSGGEDGA